MQESVLADPALLLHQNAVHDRDLACGPSEGERRNTRPDAHRLGEGYALVAGCRAGCDSCGVCRSAHGLPPALAEGQLWASPVASRAQR
jgi:hypothetical protein